MHCPSSRCLALSVAMMLATLAGACASPDAAQLTEVNASSESPRAARRSATPMVTATDPSYGYQGELRKHVTVIGSGFAAGAIAAWERNGVPDSKITVVSTQVVSSTEIDAIIDIAADADLALYDVSVTNSDKGKGIGTEMFEVTTAISLGTLDDEGGNTQLLGATDNAGGVAAVGWSIAQNTQYAVVWPGPDGRLLAIGEGRANAVEVAGTVVAGSSASRAAIWTLSGGTWTRAFLPVAADAVGGEVLAIASNENGAATILGGYESVQGKGQSIVHRQLLWRASPAGWIRSALADATSGQVRAVNARGQAVGGDGGAAAFWDSLGLRTILPGSGGPATGIDASGTIIAGVNNAGNVTKAVYWWADVGADGARTWHGPLDLPGSCERAIAVDDDRHIIGHRCLGSGSRYTSAIWVPPYDVATKLTGFGDKTDAGAAWGVSRHGIRIVGHAQFIGALWEGLLPPAF